MPYPTHLFFVVFLLESLSGCHSSQSREARVSAPPDVAVAWLSSYASAQRLVSLKAHPGQLVVFAKPARIESFRPTIWLERLPDGLRLRAFHYHSGWYESEILPVLWDPLHAAGVERGFIDPSAPPP